MIDRQAYYEGLRSVSRDDDWSGWCAFFLDAVRTQAEDNLVIDKTPWRSRVIGKREHSQHTRSPAVVRALDPPLQLHAV